MALRTLVPALLVLLAGCLEAGDGTPAPPTIGLSAQAAADDGFVAAGSASTLRLERPGNVTFALRVENTGDDATYSEGCSGGPWRLAIRDADGREVDLTSNGPQPLCPDATVPFPTGASRGHNLSWDGEEFRGEWPAETRERVPPGPYEVTATFHAMRGDVASTLTLRWTVDVA